jgi:hypothetical protein
MKKVAVKSETKYAVRPVAARPLISVVLPTAEAVAAAYAPVPAPIHYAKEARTAVHKVKPAVASKIAPKKAAAPAKRDATGPALLEEKAAEAKMAAASERAKKGASKKTVKPAAAKPVAVPAEAEEPSAKVAKLTTLAATAAKKPLAPAKDSPIHQAFIAAKFQYVKTQTANGVVAHGYAHADGRAALYTHAPDGSGPAWTLKTSLGERGGKDPALLPAALQPITKADVSAKNRADHKAEQARVASKARAARLLDLDRKRAETKAAIFAAAKEVPAAIAGMPGNVVRAAEMLGTVTGGQFDMDLLRGDKHYGHRLALLKRLFDREKVLVAETGITALMQAFYTALGTGTGRSAADKAKMFAVHCKEITKAAHRAKTLAYKAEKLHILDAKRATLAARTVPGTILPGNKPLSKKAQAAKDTADKAAFKLQLSVSSEQPAVPRPDAELTLVPADVRLLEDPNNGIVMMQMEKANSQGAICVYNNGVRVAAGVVAPETLKTLRPVPGEADLIQAVNQLLNPIVPSVPVTPVAARHLTAVLHCKELVAMTATAVVTPVSKSKKFEAPKATKKSAKSAVEETPVKAAKGKAAKGKAEKTTAERVPRTTEDRKIKSLVKFKDLTMREGTFCHAQVQAALSSKTVSEAQAKLDADEANPSSGRKIEIAWLAKKGYIEVL